MAIPTMTKEEIFSIKDINTILNERDIIESELDDLITQWTIEAKGMVQGFIIESYWQYIDSDTWRYIIKTYCKYQSLDQVYSTAEQSLTQNAYLHLKDYILNIKDNVDRQASLNVIPNKIGNFRVVNPS